MLERAVMKDLEAVISHYHRVADAMEASGLKQWHWGVYPREDILEEDIRKGTLWLLKEDGKLLASVSLQTVPDPEYADVNWLYGLRPGLFHRLAAAPDLQGRGLGSRVLDEAEEIFRNMGCDCLRCDTNSLNERANRLYVSRGMRRCGTVAWDHGVKAPFWCYEKPLTDDCPLLPLRMRPAFRGGKLTPWGGEKLKTVYGKAIETVPTGESLEVSCIPGLESRDVMGNTLTALAEVHGEKMTGHYAGRPFPLLLKLLDAREPLSVQVHPDDRYAYDAENGKLGKTEAWLILDAPEDAELVYGILPGTDRATLRAACEAGGAVRELLRRVRVKAGDVCYIPAGCVHAIGAGITLYEIQQSSDVTYRFYDWDRVDREGKKRELHIDKALDVTDLNFALDPVPAASEPLVRVLDKEYFTLDLICPGERTVMLPEITDLGMLTALEGPMTLLWDNTGMKLDKGETVFLPHACPALRIRGSGRAALSMTAKGVI